MNLRSIRAFQYLSARISILKLFRMLAFVPLWLAVFGCSEDSNPVLSGPVQSLPAQFRLRAEAEGSDNSGLTATCRLDWIFEMRSETFRTPQIVDYRGIHGGEAFRRILQNDQSGFAFNADVFGEVNARLITNNGSVELVIPINETADGRFWRELARFEGRVNEHGTGTGSWTCAPLDIDQGGYVDTVLSVDGTWTIEPL